MKRWVRITLFGEFSVELGGRTHTRFRTRKTASVLAFLAFHLGKRLTREQVAAAVWPDSPLDAGLHNLRMALASLRKQLENSEARFMVLDRTSLSLSEEEVSCDVKEFLEAIERGEFHQALALYRGPLLPGSYEEWVLPEQQRFETQMIEVAVRLARQELLAGVPNRAIPALQMALQADPYSEEIVLALVEAHVLAGSQVTAVRVCKEFEDVLETQLGKAPSESFASSVHRLLQKPSWVDAPKPRKRKSGTLTYVRSDVGPPIEFERSKEAVEFVLDLPKHARAGIDTSEAASESDASDSLAEALLRASAPGQKLCSERTAGFLRDDPAYRLIDLGLYLLAGREVPTRAFQLGRAEEPAPTLDALDAPRTLAGPVPPSLNRFFGREEELERLRALLEAGTGSVTIAGPGGNGKTRLALQAARTVAGRYPGGIYFVSLAHLSVNDDLEQAVRVSIGLDVSKAPIGDQFVSAIGASPALLVLDNTEQVLEQAGALVEKILVAAPSIQCLLTSRIHPAIGGQRILDLQPLPVASPSPGEDAASISLFVDRAQAVVPDFALSSRNREGIAAICEKLEGIPLAIELAAAQIRNYSIGEMNRHLGDRLDFLSSKSRLLPARHRSMRAVLDWSYEVLAPELQAVFRKLAVFSGDPEAEAVHYALGATRDDLSQLVARSLLHRNHSETLLRFHMLDVVRDFAREKLGDEEAREAENRHREYYFGLVHRLETESGSLAGAPSLGPLDAESANIRSALVNGLATSPEETLRTAIRLYPYWEIRGLFGEGLRFLTASLAAWPAEGHTRGTALSAAGVLATYVGDVTRAETLLTQACEAFAGADGEGHARALSRLGNLNYLRGDYTNSLELYERAHALIADADNRRLSAIIQHNMANVAVETGDFDRGEALYRSAMSIERELGAELLVASSTNGLATIYLKRKDFDAAEAHFVEAQTIYEAMGARHSVAHTRQGRGHVCLGRDAAADALVHYLAALEIDRENGARLNQGTDLRGVALSHLKLGDYEEALAYVLESCDLLLDSGYWIELGETLSALITIRVARGECASAARVAGYAHALLETHMPVGPKGGGGEWNEAVERARARLGEPEFGIAFESGRGLLNEDLKRVKQEVLRF